MSIPDFQQIMLPLLKLCEDHQEHTLWQSIDQLASFFNLSFEEREELLPSGHQPLFNNRVGWARTYLKKARLIESPKRGYLRITQRGSEVLKQNIARIDKPFLTQFEEFRDFVNIRNNKLEEAPVGETGDETPLEKLERAYYTLRSELATDLLQQLKSSRPDFFEKVVIDLLVEMGYGGSVDDAGKAIGKRGDEGIDGIIKEDKLGLDIIYVQAKKWEGTVSRPEIQKFAGALQGQRARKGIFITTSNFSKEAVEYAMRIDSKIVLIDGEQLVEFMIDHNIGVSPTTKYEIKKIDSDYFLDE